MTAEVRISAFINETSAEHSNHPHSPQTYRDV